MRHRDREESDHSGMTLCGYNATALPHSETHATLVDGRRYPVGLLRSLWRRSGMRWRMPRSRPHRWHKEGGLEVNLWVDQYRHESGVAVHDWT